MNVIKLAAFYDSYDNCVCEECGLSYNDTVEHYVMKCSKVLEERTQFWDNILDDVSVQTEVKIIALNEEDTLDLLLSKDSRIFSNKDVHHSFIINVARNINSIMCVM